MLYRILNWIVLNLVRSPAIVIVLATVTLNAQVQKNVGTPPAYSIEKRVVRLANSEFESTNYYIFVNENDFNRSTLGKIFSSLPAAQKGFVTATVFSDMDALHQRAKLDSVGSELNTDPNSKNLETDLGNGRKAQYLTAEYVKNEFKEYFIYTPFLNRYERTLVTIVDRRQLNVTRAFLTNSINDGYLYGVKWYLARSNDVNFWTSKDLTPLMEAVLLQHSEIAAELIRAGAIVSTRDKNKIDALIMASAGGNIDIVSLLIDNGAKIDEIDLEGRTALMAASLNCNFGVVKLLVKRGANINAKDAEGRTLYSYSCDDPQLLSLLSEVGVDPNGRHIDGSNALFSAIRDLQPVKVEFLLLKGTLPTIRDRNGDSPINVAESLPESAVKQRIITIIKKYL